ncbi:hypothetical protein D3C85_1792330 [compost metagenome]
MLREKLGEVTGADQCIDRPFRFGKLREVERDRGRNEAVVRGDLAAVPGAGATAGVDLLNRLPQ